MNRIFLSFANSTPSLKTLEKEDKEVYEILSRQEKKGFFKIHRDSQTDQNSLIKSLSLYKEEIIVFHFSGHAGKKELFLTDDKANAEGIAELLGHCPKLKLVILNGCSTEEQVKRLIELPTNPVIIYTTAPVNDFAATQFSISFFSALCETRMAIKDAFEDGLSAAKTVANEPGNIQVSRSIFLEGETPEGPLWGIESHSNLDLEWKIPLPASNQPISSNYKANAHLIKMLIKGLSPYNAAAKEIVEDEENYMERSLLDKRETILAAYPHPISEQLRKLLVESQAGSSQSFYDQPGLLRFKQLVNTYNTLIELFLFVLLAQLWNTIINENLKLGLSNDLKEELKAYLTLDLEKHQLYNYLNLIKKLLLLFGSEKEIPFFVKELEKLKDLLQEDTPFHKAYQFMEHQKKAIEEFKAVSPADEAIFHLCVETEEKLSTILSALSFISNYLITSVKSVDVLKYRHIKQPIYKHKMVKLVQRISGLAEEQQSKRELLDTSSVYLIAMENGREVNYLNLSPFIIDENAFDSKASIAKLYYFYLYEYIQNDHGENYEQFGFKYIYKPDAPLLAIKNEKHFKVIKDQFNSFVQSIFNQPMNAI